MTRIALVDDHILLRNGLAALIDTFSKFNVTLQANNGKDFINKVDPDNLPVIVLMDIDMDEMDGYETTRWLRINHPGIKVIALSMMDSESAIIRMIKSGAKGYLLKNCDKAELQNALTILLTSEFYMNDLVNSRMINNLQNQIGTSIDNRLFKASPNQVKFLKWVCTDLSYKEIAEEMNVSPRTVDGYRDSLFRKLEVTTRIGLALYAIKNKYVELD